MAADLRELHARAMDEADAYVRLVGAADLGSATPCAGWTLADLLAHMIGQHRGFAAAVRSGDAPRTAYAPVPFSAKGWRESVQELLAAFAATSPGSRAVAVEITVEPLPVERLVAAQLLDTVVHTWDIAHALGRWHEPSAALIDATAQVARSVPDGAVREAPGAAFAPSLPLGESPWERALAQLGRDPRRPDPIPMEDA